MKKTDDPPEDKTELPESSQGRIASPKLDEKGKPTQKAVQSAKHAHAIAKALKTKALEGRLKTAGVVTSLYDGQAPYPDQALVLQDWRNNYSTHFLASIVDRVKPQLKDPLESSPLLTHSKLPDNIEDGARKSRVFQNKITNLIRSWSGWSDLLDGITQENTIFGLATPAWIDDDWRPRLFVFDETFLAKGSGQHASMHQTAVFSQRMLVHDFLDLFRNETAARVAKYKIDECIKAANGAIGKVDETDLDKLASLRETGTLGYSYENDDRTVDLFHVLAREYDGKVDLWTVTQDQGLEIRHVEGLHDSMEDAFTIFTIQTGNRKVYGSKGLGRTLANIHIAIERGRNMASDQTFLSGFVICRADKADLLAQQPMVRHPFVYIPKSFEMVKEQFQFDVEAYNQMDQKLVAIAESLAGAFIPPEIDRSGSPNTKIEAAQRALREQAVKQGVLGRFLGQAFNLVGAMQRKICNSRNLKEAVRIYKAKRKKEEKGVVILIKKVWNIVKDIFGKEEQVEAQEETKLGDPEAVNCLIEILEGGVSPQEIALLALSSPRSEEKSDQQTADQSTVEFISANAANPMQDQGEAYQMLGEIMVGKDRVDRLRTREGDPNVRAVAIRQQLMEFSEMLDGVDIPVASIDNHPVHRQVLIEKILELMPAVEKVPTPALVKCTALSLEHFQAHLDLDTLLPPAEKKQWDEGIEGLRKIVVAAGEVLAELAANPQGLPADQVPPSVNGQMPLAAAGAPPAQQVPGSAEEERKNAEAITDITLRAQEQTLRADKQALEREKHEHQVSMDLTRSTAETAKTVSDAARAAMQEGESDAARDLTQTAPPPP